MRYVLILTVILALAVIYDTAACHDKWAHSGFQSHWGITTQCLVEVRPGVWLPETSVREIDVLDHKKASSEVAR
mgnify:CR=1 FL=1